MRKVLLEELQVLLDLHKCWKELGIIRVSNVSDLLVRVYLSLLDGHQLPL